MDMISDISGDFISLMMNFIDKLDYLIVIGIINFEDVLEYLFIEGLSWNVIVMLVMLVYGIFILGVGDSFEVISVLGDKIGNGDWDGKMLIKLGVGKLMLSGVNIYIGDINVQEGMLWLVGDGMIGEVGSQQVVNVVFGVIFGGSNGMIVNGKVINEGMLVFGDSEEIGVIFIFNGDLVNMGMIVSGSIFSMLGNMFYVDGNYIGNGGLFYLNIVLGDDDLVIDKLVIIGDVFCIIDLYINGIGDGVQIINGIEVVDVGGVLISDVFVLKNEVNVSLYIYCLYWNESDNDWYLVLKVQFDDDDSGGDDSDVMFLDGGDDGGNVMFLDDGGDVVLQYCVDIGVYMGNQWMVCNL